MQSSVRAKQDGHPEANINSIFSDPDRSQGDYQNYWSQCVEICRGKGAADFGISISYAGDLIENVNSLAENNFNNYHPGWNTTYANAVTGLKTSGGKTAFDLVAFPYYHALAPLTDMWVMDMEISLHKVVYAKTWSGAPYSKGFFPAEMSFTDRLIPTLVSQGIEWVIVSNSHLSRACKDYPFSRTGDNTTPPNKADQLNPAQAHWFNMSISRGVTPNNAVPFAFTPHYAQFVDPETAKVSKIVVIPADMAMSWQSGAQQYGPQQLASFAPLNNPEHPILAMFAADGDNDYSGGYSDSHTAIPDFASQALGAGINPTSVNQYLADYPVDPSDVVHVESGAWVNKDQDFGSPQCFGWNAYPYPSNATGPGQYDIPTGWSVDALNYCATTAALNTVQTALTMQGSYSIESIQSPTSSSTKAELSAHFYFPATTSGYRYYGTSQDMGMKPTIASNVATGYATSAIATFKAAGKKDTTPPSLFTPQRLPWNPGGCGDGLLTDWQYKVMPLDTVVWTYAYDVSGIASATLMYRIDADGENDLHDYANEVYEPHKHGLEGVSAWKPVPMQHRALEFNPYNHTVQITKPNIMADVYWAELPSSLNLANSLVDYYVQLTDGVGNVRKSDIYHVWFADPATTVCASAAQ